MRTTSLVAALGCLIIAVPAFAQTKPAHLYPVLQKRLAATETELREALEKITALYSDIAALRAENQSLAARLKILEEEKASRAAEIGAAAEKRIEIGMTEEVARACFGGKTRFTMATETEYQINYLVETIVGVTRVDGKDVPTYERWGTVYISKTDSTVFAIVR